jgi:hypothetical protein
LVPIEIASTNAMIAPIAPAMIVPKTIHAPTPAIHRGDGAARTADHRPQHHRDHGHAQEREPEKVESGRRKGVDLARGRAGLHRRQRLALDRLQDGIDARLDARGEVAVAKSRRHALADDASRGDVGERALHAAAGLDADLALLLGDHEEHAVVDALAAQLPSVGHAQREVLDRLGAEGRHHEHRHLRALGLLEGAQLLLDALLLPAAVSVPVESIRARRASHRDRLRYLLRERRKGNGGAPQQRAHPADRGETPPPSVISSVKSTLGGSAMTFSFST